MSTTRIFVKVLPNAKKTQLLGWKDDVLRIAVSAVPEKGRANKALIVFLSTLVGVSRSEMIIVRGETSRNKVIEITGGDISALIAGKQGQML